MYGKWNFLDRFSKTPHENLSGAADLFHADKQTGGQAGMTKSSSRFSKLWDCA
jgi:hypothetical protein